MGEIGNMKECRTRHITAAWLAKGSRTMIDKLFCFGRCGLSSWVLLLFNCLVSAVVLAQNTGSTRDLVIEIKKPISLHRHWYGVTVLQDRTVNLVSNWDGKVLKRSLLLSEDEYNGVLRLFEERHFRELVSAPADPNRLFHGTFAEITYYRDGVPMTLNVDSASNSHMQLFLGLEARLGVEKLRCPFPIELHGKQQDLCILEDEQRRKSQEEKRQ